LEKHEKMPLVDLKIYIYFTSRTPSGLGFIAIGARPRPPYISLYNENVPKTIENGFSVDLKIYQKSFITPSGCMHALYKSPAPLVLPIANYRCDIH